jgi:hypothetical protein
MTDEVKIINLDKSEYQVEIINLDQAEYTRITKYIEEVSEKMNKNKYILIYEECADVKLKKIKK